MISILTHSGGTDRYGCHTNRKTGEYHCHQGGKIEEALRGPIVGQASVIDGDTIEIRGLRIRFHGIDAPESSQLCVKDARRVRCGQQSALALDRFIGNRNVSCEPVDKDRYGRLVATCYLDRLDVGEWSVRNGWSVAYRRYSHEYVDEEDVARKQARGLWGMQFENPENYRHSSRGRE